MIPAPAGSLREGESRFPVSGNAGKNRGNGSRNLGTAIAIPFPTSRAGGKTGMSSRGGSWRCPGIWKSESWRSGIPGDLLESRFSRGWSGSRSREWGFGNVVDLAGFGACRESVIPSHHWDHWDWDIQECPTLGQGLGKSWGCWKWLGTSQGGDRDIQGMPDQESGRIWESRRCCR